MKIKKDLFLNEIKPSIEALNKLYFNTDIEFPNN
jgi:hypothetical protein